MNTTTQRLALTLATGLLVGSGFIVAKLLLNSGASQAAVSFVQLGGAALILTTALLLRGEALPRDRATLRYLLVSALIGIAAGPLLGNWVLARIPAGFYAVLVTLSPMFTALFGALLDRRAPNRNTLAGIGLGLVGVLLVLVPRAQRVDSEQALALVVAIGVPMLLAAGNVYRSRRWPRGLSAPAASASTLLTQGLLLAPLFVSHLAVAAPIGHTGSLLAVWPLLALLVAITIGSNLAGSTLQRVAGAAAYSQIGYVIALTGVAGSALVFGESLGASFWPALALVFAGIVLTNRAPAASASASTSVPVLVAPRAVPVR